MTQYTRLERGFEFRHGHEVLRVEAWGDDSVRVRVALHQIPANPLGALLEEPPALSQPATTGDWDGEQATLVNGQLTVKLRFASFDGQPLPQLWFHDTASGRELLAEQRQHFWLPGARSFEPNADGSARIRQQFAAYPGERIYGLGQRTHGRLDHKGLSLDLVQRNAEINVPFYLSNRGYGFLWNNPATGQVNFSDNHTRWTMDAALGIDYWVTTADKPAGILSHYADAVGHAPQFPAWALGLWQSKLRYLSQEELLEVVRGYQRRGWPLSVIVTDFFHWTAMGDWRFDPAEYPDPAAMMAELAAAGVKLMVSVWPTVSAYSENYQTMRQSGYLVGAATGMDFQGEIWDKQNHGISLPMSFYDATNPAARDFLWQQLKQHYWDLGVRVWWLDACEPELNPSHFANLDLWAGPGAQVANAYPREHARGVDEHARACGDGEVLSLARSTWAGGARYGTAVWSGDIAPTWESLTAQIRAGLSIGLAGIPWWTTDIGGFHGGDPSSEAYRELFARWLEYGTFCPLMRIHGHREPRGPQATGGPNEPWAYGERVEAVAGAHIALRERLKPYLARVFEECSASGIAPMRPLCVDFPDDVT
ncbi:MAG: family 31 glucosidase, partial [Bifidobacteriaceae bacterium]|nr:family 31 glucosidase [Bifidobacteriaceae bacterium]